MEGNTRVRNVAIGAAFQYMHIIGQLKLVVLSKKAENLSKKPLKKLPKKS